MNMDPKIVGLIVVVILVVAAAAIVAMQRRKAALRSRFGSEYERAVQEHGSERQAVSVLHDREKRVEKFHIRKLDAAEETGIPRDGMRCSRALWMIPGARSSTPMTR